jgi:hypothetical protein
MSNTFKFSEDVLIINADEKNTYYSKPEVENILIESKSKLKNKLIENNKFDFNNYAFIIVCTKNSPSYKFYHRSTFQHNFGEILKKENNFIRLAKIDATPQKNRTYTKNNTSANVRTRIYYNESKVGFRTKNIKKKFNNEFKESYPTGNGNKNERSLIIPKRNNNNVSINNQIQQIAANITNLESQKNGKTKKQQQEIQKKIINLGKEILKLTTKETENVSSRLNKLSESGEMFKKHTNPKKWSMFSKGGSKISITGLEINRQTIRNQNKKISGGEIYIKLQFQVNSQDYTLEITNNNSSSDLNVKFDNKNTSSFQTIILKNNTRSNNVSNRTPLIRNSQESNSNIVSNNQPLTNNTVNIYITNMAEKIFNHLNKYYNTNYNINNPEDLNKLFIQFAIDIILTIDGLSKRQKKLKIVDFRKKVEYEVNYNQKASNILKERYKKKKEKGKSFFSFSSIEEQENDIIDHTTNSLIVQNFSVITSINDNQEIKENIKNLIDFKDEHNAKKGELNKFKTIINSLSITNKSSTNQLKTALDNFLNLEEIIEGIKIKYYRFNGFKKIIKK